MGLALPMAMPKVQDGTCMSGYVRVPYLTSAMVMHGDALGVFYIQSIRRLTYNSRVGLADVYECAYMCVHSFTPFLFVASFKGFSLGAQMQMCSEGTSGEY